jgi:hypothetical protein
LPITPSQAGLTFKRWSGLRKRLSPKTADHLFPFWL